MIKTISTNYGPLLFQCDSRIPTYRVDTFFTKEPGTLSWIDGFRYDDTLWDVGANIGLYSLYAAKKGCRVRAFEPSPYNYHLLAKNIEINQIWNKIDAHCIALSNDTGFGRFEMEYLEDGDSCHLLNPQTPSIHRFHVQATLFSGDHFFDLSQDMPNHIKIDTDGHDLRVLKGMKRLLGSFLLRSLLIELDESEMDDVTTFLAHYEFRFDRKDKANTDPEETLYNVIFRK
jgi:FkbM family methyltransferase